MIFKVIWILVQSSLPIAVTTFGLVWWARRQGHLGEAASMEEYEGIKAAENRQRKEEKKLRKQARKEARKQGIADVSPAGAERVSAPKKKFDPLHSKWMEFGGGFYGVVAFFTYLVIEAADVWGLFAKIPNLFQHGPVDVLVSFFVASLKNFITAIAWPGYWLNQINSEQWLWAIGAYCGYWLGAKLAFRVSTDPSDWNLPRPR
jgi:hypothetical protein